ncbi:electron transfer flavoprotein subunit alpha/FixB family protein [Chloroflexota bacterium]
MSEHKGIAIFAEINNGRLSATTRELLSCGRGLADDLQQELSAIIAGKDIAGLAQEAITAGADKVYLLDSPLLKDYCSDAYNKALAKALKEIMPRAFIVAQTAIGREMAPALAFRLGASATTDCIELTIDPDSRQLLQTRPVYGGNALATFSSESYPQIAAVRPKVYSALEPDESRQGIIINIDPGLDESDIRTRIVDRVLQVKEGVRLEDAIVVVAGGRGIGSAEDFKQLEELATLLKGAVGATRPPCDNGWVSDSAQIGLTGKIITPDVYLAVALSGSSQHISGCGGSKNIIAVNKDCEANIFNFARFGIVGDWKKVIPAFTARIKELLA